MTRRFDEIELYPDSFPVDILLHPAELPPPPPVVERDPAAVSAWKRAMAFLSDLTLFVALGLALTPLLPSFAAEHWAAWTAFTSFLLLLSFFYFVGSWLIWGKTLGGTLFDLKIVGADGEPPTFSAALKRWLAMFVSIGTGGIGFALAVLPTRRTLSDRLSGTTAIDD